MMLSMEMLSACQTAAVAGGERECLQSFGKEMRFQFPGLGTFVGFFL